MIRAFGDRVPRIAGSAFISEAAYILGDVVIGERSAAFPGAVVRADYGPIRVGDDVLIEDNVVLHGDPNGLQIGNSVTLGHGAVVNSRRIGNNVLIGMNATVLHDAVIGDRCIIAAGAVVGEGMIVPDGSFVTGVPGRVRGQVTKAQMWWVERSPEMYADWLRMIEQYKRQGL